MKKFYNLGARVNITLNSKGHVETDSQPYHRECSGSVVECLTRDRGAAGSSLTGVTML